MTIRTIDVLSDEDSSSLAVGFWFYNKRFEDSPSARLLKIVFEAKVIVGQQECPREKVVVFWVLLLHAVKILGQVVLPVEGIHAREVVYFLMRRHLRQKVP